MCTGYTRYLAKMNSLFDTLVCRMGKIFILFGVWGGRVERVLISQHILAAAGRTSVDRSSKATLLLTVPGGALKSSAMDVSVRPFEIAVAMLFIKLYVVG